MVNQDGIDYMYYYFMNLWGLIKNYLLEIELNQQKNKQKNKFNTILDLYLNDKNRFNNEILANIKEPFQNLSIFLALSKVNYSLYKDNSDNNVNIQEYLYVDNPILFDASCNGLQHLSALTREINVAEQTNLIYSGKLPKYFYTF